MPRFQEWSTSGGQKVTKQAVGPAQVVAQQGYAGAVMNATKFAQAINDHIQIADQQAAKDYALQAQSQLSVNWAKKKVELQQNSATASDYLKGVAQFFQDQEENVNTAAPNQTAANAAGKVFESMRANALASSVDYASQITANNAAQANKDALDAAKISVFTDPTTYDEQAKNIETQIKNSPIPEASKDNVIKGQLEDLRRSQVYGMIQSDPYKAVAFMSKGDVGLSAEDHETMYRMAVSAKSAADKAQLANDAKVQQQTAQLEKKVQTNVAKQGDELLADNNLTVDWVKSQKDNMSEDDYRYFLGKASGTSASAKDDINTFTDLDTKARAGDDIADEARKALTSHMITEKTYTSLMDRAESHNQLPTPFKQGEQYVADVMQVNPLNPSVGATQRRADALNEYDDYYKKNPNATSTELMNKAHEISRRYQIINLNDEQKRLVAGPQPLYLVGSRNDPDLIATKNATLSAYQQGLITKQTFNREAALIARWYNIEQQANQVKQTNTGNQ
jgi:hypothetical protein